MVQPARLEGKEDRPSFSLSPLSALLSTFRSSLYLLLVVEDRSLSVLLQALHLQDLNPLLLPLLHQTITFSKSLYGFVLKESETSLQRPQQPWLQKSEMIPTGLSNPKIPIYTMAIRIWSITTSVSNARTVLKLWGH